MKLSTTLMSIPVFFVLFAFQVEAFTFTTSELIADSGMESPLTALEVFSANEGVSKVSVEISSKTGKVWKKNYGALQDCDFCKISVGYLPTNLNRISCSIKAKAFNVQGTVLGESTFAWGKCAQSFPSVDPRFLPDLAFNDDSEFGSSGAMSFVNQGRSLQQESIKVQALLLDKEHRIIWSKEASSTLDLGTDEEVTFELGGPLPWQMALACQAILTIDPLAKINDHTPLNNFKVHNFGTCESTPSESTGARLDFSPELSVSGADLTLAIFNLGKLTYSGRMQNLHARIEFFDQQNRRFFEMNHTITKDLYGFGTRTEALKMKLPSEACRVVVSLNPDLYLPEIEYANNNFELNICSSL